MRHHHPGRRARDGVQPQEGMALAQRPDPLDPGRHGVPQADHRAATSPRPCAAGRSPSSSAATPTATSTAGSS
ncbi:MAG: hypothetical protein MZV70_75730 [Desulfobacterales bacterium]|nr:hypothetical protein [Desulfobacterales bacterium]